MPTFLDEARAAGEKATRLRRAQTDLYWLGVQLGRGWNPDASGQDAPFPGKGLTPELHKPVCDWIMKRKARSLVGIWMPRWHHKTELAIIEIIQDILRNPCVTLGYFHAVDQLAEQVVAEVANHLQTNKFLRSLEPIGRNEDGKPYNILPAPNAKRWSKANEFTLVKRHRHSRFPTLFGRGQTAEITGLHMNKAFLDDVIGEKTLENSQLPAVKRWFERTIVPVVDDAVIRVYGTRWDIGAVYEEWITDKDWNTLVIPAAVVEEQDFLNDSSCVDWSADKIDLDKNYKLDRPVYGPRDYRPTQKRKLAFFEKTMGSQFPAQMMNDPVPVKARPWDQSKCEHFVDTAYCKGPGLLVLISDPAPRGYGDEDWQAQKARGGDKDAWTNAVWKIRVKGQRRERILLDGSGSKDWDLVEGVKEWCRLQKKWGVAHIAPEEVGSTVGLYTGKHREVSRQMGVAHNPIRLQSTIRGKNARFASFAATAANDEIMISKDTVPAAFLDLLLNQARMYIPYPNGRNNLREDNHVDVASYVMDPALDEIAPQAHMLPDPLEEPVYDTPEPSMSRYCGM